MYFCSFFLVLFNIPLFLEVFSMSKLLTHLPSISIWILLLRLHLMISVSSMSLYYTHKRTKRQITKTICCLFSSYFRFICFWPFSLFSSVPTYYILKNLSTLYFENKEAYWTEDYTYTSSTHSKKYFYV